MRFQILSGCGHRAEIGYLVLLLTGGLSAEAVLASEPDYMTHQGPRVESAAEVDAPIDGLGRPQAPKPSADKVDPAPTSSFLGDSTLDGLWLRARAALINASGPDAVDMGDYRLILNYDFSI